MPLSREHHTGLLFCWKLRQGIKRNVPTGRMQAYVQYFWDTHLQPHFGEEEALLFRQVPHKFCEAALAQHRQIQDLVGQITAAGTAPPEAYAALAALIDEHIRFEEREVFPYLEASLSAESLSRIGAALKKTHAAPPADNYPDEFWLATG